MWSERNVNETRLSSLSLASPRIPASARPSHPHPYPPHTHPSEASGTSWGTKDRGEWKELSEGARFPARSDEGAEGPVKWATSRLTSLTRLGTGGSLSLTAAPPHIPPLSVGCRPPGRAPPDPTVRRRYERWERDTSVASQGMNEEKERRVKRRLSDRGN